MNFTTVKQNLEKNGFKVTCFDTSKEAKEYMIENIKGKTIGFGGSVTLTEMGLFDELSNENTVYWHHRPVAGKSAEEIRALAANADIYISSVNGLAETGEIVNIDGTCNRVSATLYGHEKVYFVIGANKLAPDYDSAVYRARNIASPLNAKRLNRKTPCALKADRCYDCSSPERICNALTVFWKKPGGCDYEIILIDENLGY